MSDNKELERLMRDFERRKANGEKIAPDELDRLDGAIQEWERKAAVELERAEKGYNAVNQKVDAGLDRLEKSADVVNTSLDRISAGSTNSDEVDRLLEMTQDEVNLEQRHASQGKSSAPVNQDFEQRLRTLRGPVLSTQEVARKLDDSMSSLNEKIQRYATGVLPADLKELETRLKNMILMHESMNDKDERVIDNFKQDLTAVRAARLEQQHSKAAPVKKISGSQPKAAVDSDDLVEGLFTKEELDQADREVNSLPQFGNLELQEAHEEAQEAIAQVDEINDVWSRSIGGQELTDEDIAELEAEVNDYQANEALDDEPRVPTSEPEPQSQVSVDGTLNVGGDDEVAASEVPVTPEHTETQEIQEIQVPIDAGISEDNATTTPEQTNARDMQPQPQSEPEPQVSKDGNSNTGGSEEVAASDAPVAPEPVNQDKPVNIDQEAIRAKNQERIGRMARVLETGGASFGSDKQQQRFVERLTAIHNASKVSGQGPQKIADSVGQFERDMLDMYGAKSSSQQAQVRKKYQSTQSASQGNSQPAPKKKGILARIISAVVDVGRKILGLAPSEKQESKPQPKPGQSKMASRPAQSAAPRQPKPQPRPKQQASKQGGILLRMRDLGVKINGLKVPEADKRGYAKRYKGISADIRKVKEYKREGMDDLANKTARQVLSSVSALERQVSTAAQQAEAGPSETQQHQSAKSVASGPKPHPRPSQKASKKKPMKQRMEDLVPKIKGLKESQKDNCTMQYQRVSAEISNAKEHKERGRNQQARQCLRQAMTGLAALEEQVDSVGSKPGWRNVERKQVESQHVQLQKLEDTGSPKPK